MNLVSICKIAIKASLDKIKAPASLASGLEQKLMKSGFFLLDVTYRHTAGVYSLPKIHTDPFDRLLISQCRLEKITAVTSDTRWSASEYALKILW